jgi:hypothetical protein
LLVATAIVVPDAAGLAIGLGDGLEAAVEGDEPPQAAASIANAMAPDIKSFDCMPPDTDPGYDYSGVT